jgi:guanylate kinase
MESLHDKTLVMIVGPSSIGKSTLMHKSAQSDERFTYVQSFTTRPPRPGEHSTYLHITDEEAEQIRASGNAVTFFMHPTTGVTYGTISDSYKSEFNLLDTLSGTVEKYRSLPFKRTVTISVTTDPENWMQWLDKRYPPKSIERVKRIKEAIGSIEWSLAQDYEHGWIVNEPDNVAKAARKLIKLTIDSNPANIEIPPQATKLLQTAKSLLSYE